MIDNILKERGNTHGDFKENSFLSQELKTFIRQSKGYDNLTPYMRESLDMILHKISRIVSGDCKFKDHWIDISGYATLVSNELDK